MIGYGFLRRWHIRQRQRLHCLLTFAGALFVLGFPLNCIGERGLDWLPESSPARQATPGSLCTRAFFTEEQGADVLRAAVERFKEQPDWQDLFDLSWMKIRQGAGLVPWPRRTPLNPIIGDKRTYSGYSVVNVAFESVPGYWVSGNLYVPDNLSDPVPAVLHTHGHSGKVTDAGGWEQHGRFKADVQLRAATLARMGAVSLTIDMVGYGDSTVQFGPDAHRHSDVMTIQIWNAVRALDFLEALSYVDPSRLAVTGHSGGATQAFLLTALDERIAVSVPVAMVSAHFFGGCPCESGRPIHLSDDHFVSNPMIAAMAAPRPQLIVSVGGDWSHRTPAVEYPFLREVYNDFGAGDRVQNVHLEEEGHNYGRSKRMALYPFLAKHFGLEKDGLMLEDDPFGESAVSIETPAMMRQFPDSHPLSREAPTKLDEVMEVLRKLQASAGGLEIRQVSVSGLTDPVGVEPGRLTFGWKLRSEERGKRQTAWQVQVGKSPTSFADPQSLIWDGGRVIGAQQSALVYRGPRLPGSAVLWWRVRVWDETGVAGPWSEPSRIVTAVDEAKGWQGSWITHPDWLAFNRERLGYRSLPADSVDTPKWIEIDLGKPVAVDEVILRAVRHTVAERLGFPTHFRLFLSNEPEFSDEAQLADYTVEALNPWRSLHRVSGGGKRGRYLRLEVPVLRDVDGEICLALSQIEVWSGGINVAKGVAARVSDSLETTNWGLEALTDGLDQPGANPVANATVVLEREFTLDEVPELAVAHMVGLGTYVARLNGQRIGSRYLSPGWTDWEKRVLYDTYEVASLLKPGVNRIELHLAGGMYSVPSPEGRYSKFVGKFNPLQAIFQLHGSDPDEPPLVVSDSRWVARLGPSAYSHVFGGEDFDARPIPRRSVPAVVTVGPGGDLRASDQAADPIRTIETLSPVAGVERPGQSSIYDLGQNAPIRLHLRAEGPAGSRIRVTPAELLDEAGNLDRGSAGGGRAWWEVVLQGGGLFAFDSEFFYHGARYLEVERFPATEGGDLPVLVSIEGRVTHSSAKPVGRFRSSSHLFNGTHELIRWAQRSNMMSVLTDCPHRERLGWLEQYHLNGPSIRYTFDLQRLYRKTLTDMRDAQTLSGLVPNIAPEYIVFEGPFRDSPEWGSALILAAWQQYLFHGDRAVLEETYSAMTAYFSYLRSLSVSGLLSHGLGDWYDLGPERPGFAQLTPPDITGSAIYHEVALTLGKIARLLGKRADATEYEGIAGATREAFNARFFDEGSGTYAPATQTTLAMALVTGLCPDEKRDQVLASLIELLESDGYALTSGDVGHRYLLSALREARRDDIIYRIHGQEDRPGYGYQLRAGATSLTESWDANTRSSQNHFMLGHAMEWFYGGLAGICPDPDEPGFTHLIIDPRPVGSIRWVDAAYESDYGPVQVRWRRQGEGDFSLTLRIPPNVEATVIPPGDPAAATRVGSGDWAFNWKGEEK